MCLTPPSTRPSSSLYAYFRSSLSQSLSLFLSKLSEFRIFTFFCLCIVSPNLLPNTSNFLFRFVSLYLFCDIWCNISYHVPRLPEMPLLLTTNRMSFNRDRQMLMDKLTNGLTQCSMAALFVQESVFAKFAARASWRWALLVRGVESVECEEILDVSFFLFEARVLWSARYSNSSRAQFPT